MIRGLRYLFWRGKPPKEMDHTQVFRLSLRLKSELADEARRRFKNDPDGVVFKLSPPAGGGRATFTHETTGAVSCLKAAPRANE